MAFGPSLRANDGSLAIERLEPRHTLAGNVTAHVSGGTLLVQGDDRGAQITISQPAPGQITVSGTDTTINQSFDSVTFGAVTRNLFIQLGRGSDRLTIDQTAPIVIRGDVDIASGGGGDVIYTLASPAGVFRVGGNVRVRTVSGTREFSETSLQNLDVKGDLRIQTAGPCGLVRLGGGGDTGMVSRIGGSVSIVNAARDVASAGLSTLVVGGDVSITNSGVGCSAELSAVEVAGDIRIINQAARLSGVEVSGTNVRGNLSVTGGGTESGSCLLAGCMVRGSTSLVGGIGDDTTMFNDVDFGRAVSVVTGRGADRLSAGSESIYSVMRPVYETREDASGSTYQVVRLVLEQRVAGGGSVVFRSAVSVNLGVGSDVLDLGMNASVTFRAWAILDGAGGGNAARVGWANVAGQPRVRRFAIVGL